MYAPTAAGATRARPERTSEKITSSRPVVATTSASQWAPDARLVLEMLTAAAPNMALASTAPPTQPNPWAGKYATASFQEMPPNAASTKDTTGLRWAPDTGPTIKMMVNNPAAVAAAFSSSSSPVWPADNRWAAMPEP